MASLRKIQIFLPGTQLESIASEYEVKHRGSGSETSNLDLKQVLRTSLAGERTRRSLRSSGSETSDRRKCSAKKAKLRHDDDAYEHFHPLQDHVRPGLDVLFCGINPGCLSAETGHHFANPTNHFWRCLHGSGMTTTLVSPTEDYSLPERFNIGLTNLVDRPSAQACELSRAEMVASLPTFLDKLERHRPRFVCFVGIIMWDIIRSNLVKFLQTDTTKRIEQGKRKVKSQMGLQSYKLVYESERIGLPQATRLFVVPCTSGRVVQYQLPDKIALFKELKTMMTTPSSEISTSEMENVVRSAVL